MSKINIKNVQQWHRLDNKENQWGRQLTTYKTQVTRPATRRVTNHKWRSQRPQTAPPNSSHKVSSHSLFFQGNYIFWSYFGSQLVPAAPINCHLIPIFSVWYFIFLGPIFGGHQGHKKRLKFEEHQKCQQPYVSKASIPSFVFGWTSFCFQSPF